MVNHLHARSEQGSLPSPCQLHLPTLNGYGNVRRADGISLLSAEERPLALIFELPCLVLYLPRIVFASTNSGLNVCVACSTRPRRPHRMVCRSTDGTGVRLNWLYWYRIEREPQVNHTNDVQRLAN